MPTNYKKILKLESMQEENVSILQTFSFIRVLLRVD